MSGDINLNSDSNLDSTNSNSAIPTCSTDSDSNTRLDLVLQIEKEHKIRPLHSEYETKCLTYLSQKYNLDRDTINKKVNSYKDIHDLVRKIRTNYRQSRRNFDYFTRKFSTWLSGKLLNLPQKRGRKRKPRISEKTAEESLNVVLEYLKQHGMIDKGIY